MRGLWQGLCHTLRLSAKSPGCTNLFDVLGVRPEAFRDAVDWWPG